MARAQTTIVVGAGVAGLTSAWLLLQQGHRVQILAREFALRTVSAVSAAIWFPYEVHPVHRVRPWAKTSYHRYAELEQVPGSGVRMTTGVILARPKTGARWWREIIPDYQVVPTDQLPPGAVEGDRLRVPVVEMPLYLQFLVAQVQALGGVLQQRTVTDLDELRADLVVNCSGLGARELAADPSLVPIRGQIVQVERCTDQFWIDDDHPQGITYVVPRARDCILGGTAEHDSLDLTERAGETAEVTMRCAGLDAKLLGARRLGVKVGLRPGRPAVRLERVQRQDGSLLIHNYGHGGAGMTLAFGCAQEVVDLAQVTAG